MYILTIKRRWVGEPRLHSQKEKPKTDYYNIPNPRKTLRKTLSTESSSWVLQAKPIKSPIKMSITQCFCRRATPKQVFSVMLKWLTALRNIFRAALSEGNCLSTVTTNQDTSHLQGVSLSSILKESEEPMESAIENVSALQDCIWNHLSKTTLFAAKEIINFSSNLCNQNRLLWKFSREASWNHVLAAGSY